MRTRSPFEWITSSALKPTFRISTIVTLALLVTLNVLGEPLKTPSSPAGILSFEFAGSLAAAREVLAAWGETGKVYAALNLGLDYLFLTFYPVSIGLACVLLARRNSDRHAWLSGAGFLIAWGQLAAGLFDSLENYGLIRVLLGTEREYWPAVSRLCAIVKFSLVGFGLAYVVAAAAAIWALKRPSAGRG